MAVHDQGAGFEAVLARAGDLSAETDYVQVWCDYVRWSAETRPPAEAGAVLTRACRTLLGNERARSDQRTLRLLVRYANMQPCPQEVFRSLEAQGVGAGQALLYEAWASCLERAHRHAEAGEVYRRGLAGKAEPQARLRTRLAEFERRARRHSAPVQQAAPHRPAAAPAPVPAPGPPRGRPEVALGAAPGAVKRGRSPAGAAPAAGQGAQRGSAPVAAPLAPFLQRPPERTLEHLGPGAPAVEAPLRAAAGAPGGREARPGGAAVAQRAASAGPQAGLRLASQEAATGVSWRAQALERDAAAPRRREQPTRPPVPAPVPEPAAAPAPAPPRGGAAGGPPQKPWPRARDISLSAEESRELREAMGIRPLREGPPPSAAPPPAAVARGLVDARRLAPGLGLPPSPRREAAPPTRPAGSAGGREAGEPWRRPAGAARHEGVFRAADPEELERRMQSIAAKLDDASECSMRRLTARLEDQSRSARTAQWPDPGRGIAEVVRGALKENQAPKGYCPWGGRPNGGHKEGRSLQEPLVRTPEKVPARKGRPAAAPDLLAAVPGGLSGAPAGGGVGRLLRQPPSVAAAALPAAASGGVPPTAAAAAAEPAAPASPAFAAPPRTCLTLGSRPEPVGSAEPAGEPSAPLKQRLVSRKQIASEAAGSQGVQAHLDAATPELPSPRRGAVDAGAPAAAVPGARCGEAPGAYSYEALADEDCPSAKRARTGGWLPNPLRGLYAALGGATAGAESGDADAGTPAAAGPVVEAKGRAAPPSAPPAAAGAGSCLATARGIGGEIPGRLMEEMVREQQAAASLVLSPVRGGDDVEGQKSQRWGWRW